MGEYRHISFSEPDAVVCNPLATNDSSWGVRRPRTPEFIKELPSGKLNANESNLSSLV